MTAPWTDYLVAPLAERLKGRDWLRVDVRRGGGWNLLEQSSDGRRWYSLASLEAELLPLAVLEDRGLPQLGSVVCEFLERGYSVNLLAHKPGRRAVLKLERDDGAPDERALVAKVYRKDRGIEQRWQLLTGALGDHWQTPRILEWRGEQRTLVMEHCAGRTLHHAWTRGSPETTWSSALVELLQSIRRVPVPDNFPEHGCPQEVDILERRLQDFEAIVAEPPPRIRELTARVITALQDDPVTDMTCGHRDLYDKQLLPRESGGMLIDLDLVARTPRNLDAGNLLAHLRLRGMQHSGLPWQSIAREIASALVGDGGEGSLHRWTAASLLRLALIYCRRRGGPELVPELLASADQALTRRGEWGGLL